MNRAAAPDYLRRRRRDGILAVLLMMTLANAMLIGSWARGELKGSLAEILMLCVASGLVVVVPVVVFSKKLVQLDLLIMLDQLWVIRFNHYRELEYADWRMVRVEKNWRGTRWIISLRDDSRRSLSIPCAAYPALPDLLAESFAALVAKSQDVARDACDGSAQEQECEG